MAGGKGAWQRDYGFIPRSVDESVDPGVHPAVAQMRLSVAQKPRTLHDAMVGLDPQRILGRNKAPDLDLGKVISDPSFNPMNFFKQANSLGVNVMAGVIQDASATVPLPGEEKQDEAAPPQAGVQEDAGSDKASSSSSSSSEQKKKRKKKKKKKKGKSKKKKGKSSSSSSSESKKKSKKKSKTDSAAESIPVEEPILDDGSSPEYMLCPKRHKLVLVNIGLATSGHKSHTCDECKTSSLNTGATKIFRCGSCNFDRCRRCYAKLKMAEEIRARNALIGIGEPVEACGDKPDSEAVDKPDSEAIDGFATHDPYEQQLDGIEDEDGNMPAKRGRSPDSPQGKKAKKSPKKKKKKEEKDKSSGTVVHIPMIPAGSSRILGDYSGSW